MAVTRLERKGRKNKAVAKKRVNTMKHLSSKPVIKKIDVEAIKAEFEANAAEAPKKKAPKAKAKKAAKAEAPAPAEVEAKVEDTAEAKVEEAPAEEPKEEKTE